MDKIEFSLFGYGDCWKGKYHPGIFPFTEHPVTHLFEFYGQIKGEGIFPIKQELNAISGCSNYPDLKQMLPSVSVPAVFDYKNSLVKLSGLLPLDMDMLPKDEDQRIWAEFIHTKNAPFLPVIIFHSPSGRLKAIVAPFEQNLFTCHGYKPIYEAITRYINGQYSWGIANGQSSPKRRTFLSYDPEAWINPKLL
jgi:hypothetical protein